VTVITATDLVKRYGDFAAVDGISFEVAAGESFGLLGPNGAGKSTTMRMVGAVSTRTEGSLRVLGLDPNEHGPEIRSRLGVVPQQDNLDNELRVRENLLTYGRYFGLPRKLVASRADELLAFAQLSDRKDAKVDDLAERVEVLPDRLLLYSQDGEETQAKVHERGLSPAAVLVRRSTLEDVFLHLTGRTLVD
jgi:lipooligosaccharide transport system ATP-binding protein